MNALADAAFISSPDAAQPQGAAYSDAELQVPAHRV